MNEDFPCEECGHSRQIHSVDNDHKYLNWFPCLSYNIIIEGIHRERCRCSKYIPSNLKYLEALYEENHK